MYRIKFFKHRHKAKLLQGGDTKSGSGEHSVIHKIAYRYNKVISPIVTSFAFIGAAALGFMVLMLMWSVIARRLTDTPMRGTYELTELSLAVLVFTVLAYEFLEHQSMVIEFFTSKMPKKVQQILSIIIYTITLGMLGILCWRLVAQGMRVQGFNQTTRILEIPIYPFIYLAAAGILLLAIVYIKNLLFAIDKVASSNVASSKVASK